MKWDSIPKNNDLNLIYFNDNINIEWMINSAIRSNLLNLIQNGINMKIKIKKFIFSNMFNFCWCTYFHRFFLLLIIGLNKLLLLRLSICILLCFMGFDVLICTFIFGCLLSILGILELLLHPLHSPHLFFQVKPLIA